MKVTSVVVYRPAKAPCGNRVLRLERSGSRERGEFSARKKVETRFGPESRPSFSFAVRS